MGEPISEEGIAAKPNSEEMKIAFQFDTELLKDLSAELRHCDIVAMTFLSLVVAAAGGFIAFYRSNFGGLPNPFEMSPRNSFVDLVFLLFNIAVTLFSISLRARIIIASQKIAFIGERIRSRSAIFGEDFRLPNHILTEKLGRLQQAPYVPFLLIWVVVVITGFEFLRGLVAFFRLIKHFT